MGFLIQPGQHRVRLHLEDLVPRHAQAVQRGAVGCDADRDIALGQAVAGYLRASGTPCALGPERRAGSSFLARSFQFGRIEAAR